MKKMIFSFALLFSQAHMHGAESANYQETRSALTCNICLDLITAETGAVLMCMHKYHTKCLKRCATCPECRKPKELLPTPAARFLINQFKELVQQQSSHASIPSRENSSRTSINVSRLAQPTVPANSQYRNSTVIPAAETFSFPDAETIKNNFIAAEKDYFSKRFGRFGGSVFFQTSFAPHFLQELAHKSLTKDQIQDVFVRYFDRNKAFFADFGCNIDNIKELYQSTIQDYKTR